MKNLITAIERTGQQLFDRAFLKVFVLGMLTTVGAILISYLISSELMKEVPLYSSDWQWWQDFVNRYNWMDLYIRIFLFRIYVFCADIDYFYLNIS